jgi:COP9 signalosome complex subunit 1
MPKLNFCKINKLTASLSRQLEKLDTDLKNYKSNSIKESIRRGHDDLGDHYLDSGDLSNALKCYSRARDYCTSGKHVVNMCLNVIKVGRCDALGSRVCFDMYWFAKMNQK